MMEEKKETKTYRFECAVIAHADQNPLIPSFAEWCCDRYKKEFMDVEILAEKMDHHFKMANVCRDKLGQLKEEIAKGSDLKNLNKQELSWIRNEAPGRIKKATFEGVYKSFVNTFDRKDINRKQFRLMVNRQITANPDQKQSKLAINNSTNRNFYKV